MPLESSQHHPPVYDHARSLIPLRRLVAPCAPPLAAVPPRVPQLNQLGAINIAHIQDAVGMPHHDPQLGNVIVAPWWATRAQNVVVFLRPRLKEVPELPIRKSLLG
jgi:hypothetical protein